MSNLPNQRGDYIQMHFHNQTSLKDGDTISETKVLRSNAGYYIGHEYEAKEFGDGVWLPYDRISGYYPTRELAEADLEIYGKELP